MVNLDRCNGSCNTLNDLSSKICVPGNTEDVNLNVFNIVTRINESKSLIKHISCGCKCKFDGKKVIHFKNGIKIFVDVSVKIQQKNVYAKKITLEILLHVLVKLIDI